VREELDLPLELRAQLHTPAGLNIGAATPAEVAVSILAELISEQHAHPAVVKRAAQPEEVAVPAVSAAAVDPVCGMQVAISPATPQLVLGGERIYFCGPGCRDTYASRHADDTVAT
jgi:xanthine dehydrogenase accessory factor